MGSIFKKQFTKPMPVGAETSVRGGKHLVRWTDRKGKKRSAELTADGTRIRVIASTYTAKYRDGSGVVREVATGCSEKEAARSFLADLTKTAGRIRGKEITQAEAKIGEYADVLLTEHIAAYISHLRDRRTTSDWIKTTETYLTTSATGCGWRYLRDLSADHLTKYLAGRVADDTMSARVHNVYAQSWVAFGNWLIGTRGRRKQATTNGEKRLLSNPFTGLCRIDERTDRRRESRALTDSELERLVVAARRRPLEDALLIRRGARVGQLGAAIEPERVAELIAVGKQRALIYRTMVLTGLRLNEITTLSNNSFSFGDVPFIRLDVANEKNRDGNSIPLRSDLASELQQWVKGKPPRDRAFYVPSGLLRILDRDLKTAGVPKIDEDGRRVHVHALRKTFGTHLSKASVAPRTAQALMRHSKIELTMNVYTDARLLETASAVESLDLLRPARTLAPVLAPTSDYKGRFQPFKSTSDNLDDTGDFRQDTKKPRKPLGFTGLSKVEDKGLENTPDSSGKVAVAGKSVPLVSHSGENVALWSDIRTLIDACPDLPAEARQRLIMHGDEACRVMLTGDRCIMHGTDDRNG